MIPGKEYLGEVIKTSKKQNTLLVRLSDESVVIVRTTWVRDLDLRTQTVWFKFPEYESDPADGANTDSGLTDFDIGYSLALYTNKESSKYDSEFTAQMYKLMPSWLLNNPRVGKNYLSLLAQQKCKTGKP